MLIYHNMLDLLFKIILLHQLNLAEKMKAEMKFIKEEKHRNAVALQVFLTQRNFLCAEYLMPRFSWGSNKIRTAKSSPYIMIMN